MKQAPLTIRGWVDATIPVSEKVPLKMTIIKGYRLYVNLGASQVRRRLKGVGCGVRKVETAGVGRAVIIHTATGEHRRRLRALFEGLLEPATQEED